jgi:hypothetical protein
MKIKALMFTFIFAFGATAHAAIEEDFRCLISSGTKPISLEFRQVGDAKVKWSVGYVLYKGSKQAIAIFLAKSEVTDKPEGRPWEFEDTWAEVVGGKITGTYTVSHQGATITSFTYKSDKDGKEFSFAQDIEHTGDRACKW